MVDLKAVIDKIVAHADKSGRILSEIFLELPSREEYPDYYTIISSPIALDIIRGNIESGKYASNPDQFKEDFQLMISNAKTYNLRGSVVYRDAVALMKLFDSLVNPPPPPAVLAAPSSASSSAVADAAPRRASAVKASASSSGAANSVNSSAISAAFNSIMDDLEEFTPAFEELPDAEEYPDYFEVIKRPISLAEIGAKVRAKKYSSFQDMEKDLALMVKNAETFNELQSPICVAARKILKYFQELAENGGVKKAPAVKKSPFDLDSCKHNGHTYRIGDFAYFLNENNVDKPIIGQLIKIWTNPAGEITIQANWYLRPEDTTHPRTRKFYVKEVFKWDRLVEHVITDLIAPCLVMHVKEFKIGRPDGWVHKEFEKDVWICESLYIENGKKMEKIKNWSETQPEEVRSRKQVLFAVYDSPVMLEKVPSPFADGSEIVEGEEGNEDKTDEDSETDRPVIVKRKRGRPRKDVSLAAQALAPTPPPKTSARLTKAQQKQAAQLAAQATAVGNPEMVSQYQQAQMRNYALYQQQSGNQQMMNWLNALNMQAQAARAMAPPTKSHRTSKSIVGVTNAGPDSLPDETIQQFRNVDGKMSWFTAPPIYTLPQQFPTPSAEYLEYKKRKAEEDPADENVANGMEIVPIGINQTSSALWTPMPVADTFKAWEESILQWSDRISNDAKTSHMALFQ